MTSLTQDPGRAVTPWSESQTLDDVPKGFPNGVRDLHLGMRIVPLVRKGESHTLEVKSEMFVAY